MLKGLLIRIKYTKATLMQQYGKLEDDSYQDVMRKLRHEAFLLGWLNHRSGFDQCPRLFNELPFLALYWQKGWGLRSLKHEILQLNRQYSDGALSPVFG